MTVYYDDRHERIVARGPAAIAAVLLGDDVAEARSLLLCLDYYLDPYYGHTLPYEAEIWPLLQTCLVEAQDDGVIAACLQLLGDYATVPLPILEAGLPRVKERWRPDARALVERP
ncbi:MAG: hypothetical protein IKI21_02380 [Oscillospiraceae bacterium]|nr:hypothetical protein [Oscillospiraceae bacterium]